MIRYEDWIGAKSARAKVTRTLSPEIYFCPELTEANLSFASSGCRAADARSSDRQCKHIGPQLQEVPKWPSKPKLIRVNSIGNLANRMIQYMVAISLADQVSNSIISGVDLPEWGVNKIQSGPNINKILNIYGQTIDVAAAANALNQDRYGSVDLHGYLQDARNFSPSARYRSVFPETDSISGFGADYLVISLRMAEVLSANFPPYVLLPIDFYRDLVRETKLTPVFFGQLTPSLYLDELKSSFPGAKFIAGQSALHDFQVIRNSTNICLSVSTFSWLAAWLSNASKIIMPLSGLFDPVSADVYFGGVYLIPMNDKRYTFYSFPFNTSIKQNDLQNYHATLKGSWRVVTEDWVNEAYLKRRKLVRNYDEHLNVFDEESYLSLNKDVKDAVQRGLMKSGRDHYMSHGFSEQRAPLLLSEDYHRHHLDAAVGLAQGEYIDMVDYHARVEYRSSSNLKPNTSRCR